MPRDAVNIRRNGPYAPLSAFYADDDAIAALDQAENDRAELLFVRAIAFCARTPEKNGFVSSIALETGRVLRRKKWGDKTATVHTVAEELVKLDLWIGETDGYRITKWHKWNRTAEEIATARTRDRNRKSGGTDNAAA